MKKYFLIILFLLSQIISISQTSDKRKIVGKYLGYDNCTISSLTLTIGNHNKFETNYTGHYFTNKMDKGKWKIIGDTLILKLKKEDWYKFIILNNKLCEVNEANSFCNFCLLKE